MFQLIIYADEVEKERSIAAYDRIDCFNNAIETIQNVILVIGVIVVTVYIISSILGIRRRSVRYTEMQLSILKTNGKYIPGIFVELNNCKEVLRYFLFGKKWKHRIIFRFNNIYNNVYGIILKKGSTEENLRFYLNRFSSMYDVENAIDSCLDYHNRFRERKVKLKPEYKESEILFELIYYPFSDSLMELQYNAKAAASNYLVLTGSAGNGKTNLLCSISELGIKLGHAVIFLNSREIDEDLGSFILKRLKIHETLVKNKDLYFRIVNAELCLRRKKLFIIIDAVNENERKGFGKSIQTFVNEMSSFQQIKILVSCRNEYYQDRYETEISYGIKNPHLVYDLKSGAYPISAIDRLIERYKSYFQYTGYISDAVKSVICEHLLLLRVFFEVNKNSNKDALSIKKHEVFAEYLRQVKDSCAPDIETILNLVVDNMLNSMQFDNVDKSVLDDISEDEIDLTFDETVLLNKKLVFHDGTIARKEKEVVYFVFDEIRDYYIARRIMQTHTNEEVIDSDAILKQVEEIRNAQVSCEEGIMHYTYVFFRTVDGLEDNDRKRYCERILGFYRISNNNRGHSYRHRREEFLNFGLKIIFTTGLPLTDFEIEYVRDCLRKVPTEDGGKLFDLALHGTQVGLSIDLNLYFDILFGLKDKKAIIRAYKAMAVSSSFAGIDLPIDLIQAHKNIVNSYPNRASQIQKAAELFMIMFHINDPEREYKLHNYFCELPNHQEIRDEMLHYLKQAIGE